MTDPIERLREAVAEKYSLERELGSGGMATVYLAQDLRHRRSVAMKVLKPEIAHAVGPERFLREIGLAASLSHPHILPLYDSGDADGVLFYCMPYVQGESLRERLDREKQLAIQDALHIAYEVADALDYAHRQQVLHRDIKPENIMLEGGHAFLMDFGIGRAMTPSDGESLTETGLALGTPAYMSPEQATATEEMDGRTDIYALGCVVYEMLAGKAPYTGANFATIVHQHVMATPPHITHIRMGIPSGIDAAILRAMAKTPADRFRTAKEFSESLQEAVANRNVQTGALAADGSEEPPEKSIAVLPLLNMSADPENEYFSDGMTDELINALAKVDGLHVVARTSSFAFKGKHEDVRAIGRQLNVSGVLEGSVRKAGNRIRVTAQLINVEDGYRLWSGQYDRELDDVFAIQDDISRHIVDVLKITLLEESPRESVVTNVPQAYELYLKGRYQWNRRTERGLKKGIECFENALLFDEQYAPAYAGLADSHAVLGLYGLLPPKDVMPKAKALATKALEIDPSLADARASLGCVHAMYEWDWKAADREFQQAIKENPEYTTARHWYATNVLLPLGRFEESNKQIRRAQSLDPLSLVISTSVGIHHYYSREYERAVSELLETIETDENYGMAHFFLGHVYMQLGRHDDAISSFEKAILLSDTSAEAIAALAHAQGVSGNQSEAERRLQGLLERGEQSYVSPTLLALVYVGLERHDDALGQLEQACEIRATDVAWIKVRPTFDPIRDNERFEALIERIGFES